MRKGFTVVVLAAVVVTSGCASLTGKSKTPDEFQVARNAPLIIPPDFTLAPPLPPENCTIQNSAAETSMLDQAGREDAPVGIRSTVWDQDTRIVDKGAETLQILAAAPANTNIATAQAGQ